MLEIIEYTGMKNSFVVLLGKKKQCCMESEIYLLLIMFMFKIICNYGSMLFCMKL